MQIGIKLAFSNHEMHVKSHLDKLKSEYRTFSCQT